MLETYRRVKQQRDAAQVDGGFTLIELLIVIVVLGILAAVVVFSLGSVTKNAAQSACQTDVASVNTAEAAYLAQNGAYSVLQSQLIGASGYLQSWPSSPSHYTISIAVGAPNAAPGDISVTPNGGGTALSYTPTGAASLTLKTTFAAACANAFTKDQLLQAVAQHRRVA